TRARWLTFAWALLPLAFALPAPPCFAWAAWRLHSRALAVEAAGYLVVCVVWIALSDAGGAVGSVGDVIAVAAGVVATARAFMVRRRLLHEPPERGVAAAPVDTASDAGWTPVFPADKLSAERDSLARAVACNGRDRHRLTMPLPQAAGIGLTGLAIILLDVYFHVYTRSIGVGIGLMLASVLVALKARWVDGPVLYYLGWGQVHRLPLTSVTAVSAARPKGGTAWVLLSAPGLEKPLRVYLRNRGYVMPSAARDHLRAWLSAPHVQWMPEATALFEEHDKPSTLPARRRHRLLWVTLTVVLPLALLGSSFWLAYRRSSLTRIAGAPGYRTFTGPRGKPLPVGRPWGRACQRIRFAPESDVPTSTVTQIASVVGEARRDGLDVTLESRSLGSQSAADAEQVSITENTGEPPRLSNGQLEHIGFGWDAKLDPDGKHEDLTFAYGQLWAKTVEDDPLVLRRSVRQLIALTQGILSTSRSDSGIARNSSIDRFTEADIAAMDRMSGCPR
ncbi:MAG TPA: hypothetical protein VGL26_10680, partial [Jatrophihabitans sp.]